MKGSRSLFQYTDLDGKKYSFSIYNSNDSYFKIEDFIINVFIPNEITYYNNHTYIPSEKETNDSFIQYEAIEKLTRSEWLRKKITRTIEQSGIIVEGPPKSIMIRLKINVLNHQHTL